MATPKKIKSSKGTPGKGKIAKTVTAKKPVAKAQAKSKPATKAKPKVAAKKAPASKAKKPQASVKKPAATKAKVQVKKAVKPVIGKKATTKSSIKGKPSAAKPKVTLKQVTKPVIKAKVAKPLAKGTGVQKAHPVPAGKAPQAKGITKPAHGIQGKSAPAPKPKVLVQGTKGADLPKTHRVGASLFTSKPTVAAKPKTVEVKPAKPSTGFPVKHTYKMPEKKEFKPMMTSSEEIHKTRYSDKELEEFDQLIDQKLIVAREQLEFYLKQLEDMAENPDNKIKGLDDGLSTLESERVSSMAARQQKLIQHLENAKIRIKNKVYGICRETGKLISKERLRAVPHATLSIEAKQAQN